MDAITSATDIVRYSRARLMRTGNAVAIGIGLWTIIFPTQLYALGLSVCVGLPLWALALEMRTRGALGFEERRGRRYPLSLATIVLLPSLALAMRAATDLNFENYTPLIAMAVFSALAIFGLFWRFDPAFRGDINQGATIAIFAFAYCYGTLAFADVMLDGSSGQDIRMEIQHKRIHVSGGSKGSSVWHQLKLDPEASPIGANWINVRPNLWHSFHRGDKVCVHVGTGFFAIPWYAVGYCAV